MVYRVRRQKSPGRESYETGRLREGVGDTISDRYDSLADFHVSSALNTIELRLPWLLLNFSDPSTRQITGDARGQGLDSRETIETIGIGAVTFTAPPGERTDPSGRHCRRTRPSPACSTSAATGCFRGPELARFEWEARQEPAYHERLKGSYDALQRAFGAQQRSQVKTAPPPHHPHATDTPPYSFATSHCVTDKLPLHR